MTPRSPGESIFSGCRGALVAAAWVALCLGLWPAAAHAQTSSIPLSTLPTAPTSGTLPNGVNFDVNVGTWYAPTPTNVQGYIFFPATSPQIWNFDQPVSLRFGLRGLNIGGECFRVPVGTVAEFIHPNHTWDPATRLVCRGVDSPTSESIFTLAGPVTQFVLEAVGQAAGGRGPGFIEVTVDVGIDLMKSATAPSPLTVGSTVDYSFLVTNTGDVELSQVAVTDPLPGMSPISCPATTLAGGASTTCTASYTVTQADVTAGVINNTATASGEPATGTGAVTAQDSTTVTPTQLPAIDIQKSGDGPDPLVEGETVNYEFLVTNTGNVPLTNVSVSDPLPGLSPINCPATTLAPGADTTCTATYVVTAADVVAGVISNTATAQGTPPSGPEVSDQDSETVPPTQLPAIELDKSGSGPDPLVVGGTVSYEFLVSNTGNVPLTGVAVTDPLPGLSPISCPGPSLGAGASMTCTATYTVTQADVSAGVINNTATAQGTPPSGPDVSAQDSASVPPTQLPAIELDKSGSGPDPLVVGETVSYEFRVTNTGNVPLTGVTVTDPLPGISPINCPSTTLAAASDMTCTATYVVTQTDVNAGVIDNTATAGGTPPSGPDVSAQDSASVPPTQIPRIVLDKTGSGPDPLSVGATVSYEFLVANTGNVPLSGVTVTDTLPGISPINCPGTTLAAGANMTCTASYVVMQADVNAGVVDNTATAQGTPPSGPDVSAMDAASVPPSQLPAIELEKSGTGPDPLTAGATVTYQFLISNTGNVPLENVTVTDPLPGLSPIACPGAILDAGAAMTCTATYTVTPADVDAGLIQNTASVAGTASNNAVVTAESSAMVPPAAPVPTVPLPALVVLLVLLCAGAVWTLRQRGWAAHR